MPLLLTLRKKGESDYGCEKEGIRGSGWESEGRKV